MSEGLHVPPQSDLAATVAALESRLALVEGRAAELEARAGIEAAMIRYMCACDSLTGKGAAVAAAFTRDGIWEAVDRVEDHAAWAAQGTEALVEKFDRNHTRLPFSIHFLTNPRIDRLDREAGTATARWYYFEPCTFQGTVPLWTAGHYVNDLAVEDGVWKLSHLRVATFFSTRFTTGWVEEPAYDTTG